MVPGGHGGRWALVWVDCTEEQFKDVNRHSRKDLSLRKQNKRMVDMELEQVSMGGRGSVSMGSHGRL